MKEVVVVFALMIAIAAIGIGVGWGIGTTVSPPAQVRGSASAIVITTQTSSASYTPEPYVLSMPEIMGNVWNSSGEMQPKFLVQSGHGFLSSANISVPVHRLIQLTIVSYDTPTDNSTDSEGKVTGTVGGVVYLINGTQASASDASMATPMGWGQNISSVPGSILAHTFTIQQLGINIPVVGGSTVIAYLDFDKPGTYSWICLTPCGSGADGMSDAMATAGWMAGVITVH